MDKDGDGNIHLMNRCLIWNAMMEEGWRFLSFGWPSLPDPPPLESTVEREATEELTGENMQNFLARGGGLLLFFLLSGFIVPATLSCQVATLFDRETATSSFVFLFSSFFK